MVLGIPKKKTTSLGFDSQAVALIPSPVSIGHTRPYLPTIQRHEKWVRSELISWGRALAGVNETNALDAFDLVQTQLAPWKRPAENS